MKRSAEFLEGWAACDKGISKPHNPYKAGQPWLLEFPPKDWELHLNEWDAGWNKRFYGEALHSDP